ncbi:MAG TPA: hypothetical protein VGY31_03510 [Terriglobia bacterium]|nr:hypothetical protein [Terriglobia bacterium]
MKESNRRIVKKLLSVKVGCFLAAAFCLLCWSLLICHALKAAPQSYTLQLTGTPAPLMYTVGEWIGSIWDDTALTAPPNPTAGEIGIFLFCSPSGDHYLTWPENFVSAPPATLRKSTCVSAQFVYDSNAQMWFPVSQPMIFESAARP